MHPPWPSAAGSPARSAPQVLRWVIGLSMFLVHGSRGRLIPDKIDAQQSASREKRRFGDLLRHRDRKIARGFFLAEIGDKTQIATAVALAAHYKNLVAVVGVPGTTLGMLLVRRTGRLPWRQAGAWRAGDAAGARHRRGDLRAAWGLLTP